MFSGLTPSSRQRKFCEGFLFFPIKHLRKYGNFIFRQYARHSGVKTLLDMKMGMLDYNTRYATEISRCITGSASPQAALVLGKMEDLYPVMMKATNEAPGVYQDFNELIIHYYREVSVYHGVVLPNLMEELSAVLKPKKGEQIVSELSYDHISKVHRLVREFVLQSKTIVALMEDFAVKENNSAASYSHQRLFGLLGDIKQMYFTQKTLSQLLKKWETDKNLHGFQTYYN